MQLDTELVSEVKTKTYNIHAQEENNVRGQKRATKHGRATGKRKRMLVLLGLTIKSLHN